MKHRELPFRPPMKHTPRHSLPALAVVLLLLPVARGAVAAEKPPRRDLRDVIGVTHVSGAYHLSERDFLGEGAEAILALGSRVIKLYLTVPPASNPVRRAYPFNSQWPQVRTLVELARTPYFRSMFDKPFTTYILTRL